MELPLHNTEENARELSLEQIITRGRNDEGWRKEAWRVGEAVADWLLLQRQQRAKGTYIRHVRDESNLPDEARRAVAVAASDGQRKMGLQPGVVATINDDANFRAWVLTSTLVNGSLLKPLSYLIYGLRGVENIHVLRSNLVMAITGDQRYVFRDIWADKEDPDVACRASFDSWLGILGVGGDNTGLSDTRPRAEATFGSVARFNIAIAPTLSSDAGLQATIRLHSATPIPDYDAYVKMRFMDSAMATFMIGAIKGRLNILIAGSPNTGKTSFLRVSTSYFERDAAVLVIEDGPELYLDKLSPQKRPWAEFAFQYTTVVSARQDRKQTVSLSDLVRFALRNTPDRLIIGESRGAEMAEVGKALTTGLTGSLTTIHADSAIDAIAKGARYMTEDSRYTNNYPSALDTMYDAFDLVIFIDRYHGKRIVKEIVSVAKGNLQPLYTMLPSGGWHTNYHKINDIVNAKAKEALLVQFPEGFLPDTGA